MKNKYARYILGFFLLGLIFVSLFLSKTALFVVSIFFIIIAMREYRNMFKEKNIFPHKFLPEIFAIACTFVFSFSNILNDDNFHNFITPFLIAFIVTSFLITILKNKKPYVYTSLSTIAAGLFILCGLYIIKIANFCQSEYYSISLIFIYFAAVLSGDWAASILGPKYKKILLAKEISPNKTLFGAFVNLFVSCLISLSLTKISGFNVIQCLIFGCVVSIFSQIGDLTISCFKREAGLKHSGNLFYDYGGVLDRMDSFIFSAPAVYYLLYLLLSI